MKDNNHKNENFQNISHELYVLKNFNFNYCDHKIDNKEPTNNIYELNYKAIIIK